jgi:hypothetical protein
VNDWDQILTENPKVLWGLVADVVKAVKAAEGDKKTGRRPSVTVESLDELYDLLFQPYADAPFTEVFAKALGGRSQRAFAAQVGFNQATISRLLSGKTPPTVEMIERLSYALNVRPTCFREYRAMKLGQVVTDVLLEHPELSTALCRRLAAS